MDGADVCGTSSRASRRPPKVTCGAAILVFKMAAPEMTSTRTWGEFFDPYWGGGAKWRPFRFRRPSWMTSFAEPEMRSSKMAAESGRAAILHLPLNGDRKTRPILLSAAVECIQKLRTSSLELVAGTGSVFCLLVGVSPDYAQPITGKVTEVTCTVIGRAQPELTQSKRQKTGPGQDPNRAIEVIAADSSLLWHEVDIGNWRRHMFAWLK